MKRLSTLLQLLTVVVTPAALAAACHHDPSGAAPDAAPSGAASHGAAIADARRGLLAATPPGAGPAAPGPGGPRGLASTFPAPSGMPTRYSRENFPTPPDPNVPLGPVAQRAPDWDLDARDPARDYARRYAFFTGRYGDSYSCMTFGDSQPSGTRRRVEVRAGDGCPSPGTVRDVFLVDVDGDRLTVDDTSARAPLAHWPDGSDPEGPASQEVTQFTHMPDWKSPMKDTLTNASLVPIRVQAYGRGTYPVVSLAGWHGDVQIGASPDTLRPLGDLLCKASGDMPFALLAAADRSHLLRVRCLPTTTRWDTL